MKNEEKIFLLEIAKLAAKRSSASRLQVGAVVSDTLGNPIATGFNGTVKGYDNFGGEFKNYQEGPYTHVCSKGFNYKIETDHDLMVHAEINLIAHAARRGISINGGHVFSTHSPCMRCCASLIQCGIIEILFLEKHRSFSDVEKTFGNYVKLTEWA